MIIKLTYGRYKFDVTRRQRERNTGGFATAAVAAVAVVFFSVRCYCNNQYSIFACMFDGSTAKKKSHSKRFSCTKSRNCGVERWTAIFFIS